MDNFELLETIGRGSFGKIHKVRRVSDGKILARKEINYGRMSESEKVQLVSEVNILRELKHPNIVRYYERYICKESHLIYIFMEHCEGGDLYKLISQARSTEKKYLDEEVVWRLFSQILMGLHECHTPTNLNRENGHGIILHRDLKPENVLLDRNFVAKIGDFGLSKSVQDARELVKTFAGTPYYMSPELLNDAAYDVKSDIWSLGCILDLFAYDESPPFEATSQTALSIKINEGKINKIPSHYSDDLGRVIKAMLHIEPSRRPQTRDFFCVPQIKLYINEQKLLQQSALLKAREDRIQAKERELKYKEIQIKLKEKSLAKELGLSFAPPAKSAALPSANNHACPLVSSDCRLKEAIEEQKENLHERN